MKLDVHSQSMYSQMVVYRTCDIILWPLMSSVPLKQSFPFGPISSFLFSDWCGFKSSDRACELETKSVTLQDAYLYLLLSLVKHQRAYCFHKSWPCIFRKVVWNWRYHIFTMKAVKVQFSSVRIGLWCHLRCSIVSWLGNSQSRRLQIPHRLIFWFSVDLYMCRMSVKTNV